MTANELIRLLRRNLLLIIGVALGTAAVVYVLTRNAKQKYTTKALVSTGIISAFSIENPGTNGRVDRDYTLSELENLTTLATAYETIEELSTHLLAQYLLFEEPQKNWVMPLAFESIQELELDSFSTILQALPSDSLRFAQVQQWREAETDNAIKEIIYSDEEYFGIESIQENLKVYRKGNSDVLEMVYTTTDPAIAQRTLERLIDVFMHRHADLKKSKTSSIVAFFSDATQESANRLEAAESELLDFRTQNKIINYYEQTRSIAYRKEDLDELLFKESMALRGSEASIAQLEEQLGNKQRLAELNKALLEKRAQISSLTTQLAQYDLMATDGREQPRTNRTQIVDQLAVVKREMNEYTTQAFYAEQTPAGLDPNNLLNEWLSAIIAAEESKARLDVIQLRKQDFETIYSQYAPWGSKLKRIEREIGLAEEAYLENLHSYNQAILHRENTLMASKLKVLDAPFYPKDDNGKQRAILILAGLFGGGILVAAVLTALGFMDTSLTNPRLAMAKTGLPLAALFPNYNYSWKGSRLNRRLNRTTERGVSLLLQQTKVEAAGKSQQPTLVFAVSQNPKAGRSFVSVQLVEALRAEEKRVLYLYPVWEMDGQKPGVWVPVHEENSPYLANQQTLAMMEKEGLAWTCNSGAALAEYNYVIFEMPALLSGWYPASLLEKADLIFWLSQAQEQWDQASQQALEVLQKGTNCPIKLVLNKMPITEVEQYLGNSSRQAFPSYTFKRNEEVRHLFPNT